MNQRSGRRVALVTGGRRGIGLAIAEGLAADSFDLAITGTAPEGAVALGRIAAHGVESIYVRSDVAEVRDHARLLDTIESSLGAVDVLISNAGIPPPRRLDLLETTEASFDLVLGVNLRGAFFLAQAVARRMIQAERSDIPRAVVFVTSCSAEMVSLNRVEYCISKAGLAMAVKGFAFRLAGEGIAVFEVRPGIIRTDMTTGVAAKYDTLIGQGLVPTRRWGEGQDVAAAVRALVRGEMGFATGSVISVDGGLTIPRL